MEYLPRDLKRIVVSEKKFIKLNDEFYTRRSLLRAAALAGAFGALTTKGANALGMFGVSGGAPPPTNALKLSPPILSSPVTLTVTTAGGAQNLGAHDYQIVMPASPVLGVIGGAGANAVTALTIDGKNIAGNISLIGGEIAPEAIYNPATMMLLDGSDWAVSIKNLGFTGATGGTFQIQCWTGPWFTGQSIPVTAPIAWNASASDVQNALNTAMHAAFPAAIADACFTVTGSAGGPWVVVPGNNAGLGRCKIPNVASLTGSPVLTTPVYNWKAGLHSLDTKDYLGTFYIEGLLAGENTSFSADAFNSQAPYANSILVHQNCHWVANFDLWQKDWNHPDGTQNFNGPPKWYAYLCDYIASGNGIIDQPAEGASPVPEQALYDHWFEQVQMRGLIRDSSYDPYIPDGNTETTGFFWQKPSGVILWNPVGTTNYINLVLKSNQSSFQNSRAAGQYTNITLPAGFGTIKGVPSTSSTFLVDPSTIGIGYVSPGYQNPVGSAYPFVTQRL